MSNTNVIDICLVHMEINIPVAVMINIVKSINSWMALGICAKTISILL